MSTALKNESKRGSWTAVASYRAVRGVEKQHLVGLGDGLVIIEAPYVHSPIREPQLRASGALFRALAPARALAVCLPDGDRLRFQERVDGNA